MVLTRRSAAKGGARGGGVVGRLGGNAAASLRLTLARLGLSSWVALAAGGTMLAIALLGRRSLDYHHHHHQHRGASSLAAAVVGVGGAEGNELAPAPFPRQRTIASVRCLEYDYMPWQDWRACLFPASPSSATLARTFPPQAGTPFLQHLEKLHKTSPASLPWNARQGGPTGAGVLVEAERSGSKALFRAIHNAMENLPAAWPIYVAGGPATTKGVADLFPTEVAVGKILLDDLGKDELSTDEIREMLTKDMSFYDKLPGENWLFFSIDAAICSPQRHLLEEFIAKDFGWWGAPWRFEWKKIPRFGGSDIFTLRNKKFVQEIITRHTVEMDVHKDGWFTEQAFELVGEQLSRPPAPLYEGIRFVVKHLFHHRPFAVHTPFHLPPNWEMKALMEHCTDFLSTFSETVCAEWPEAYCAAEVKRDDFVQGINFACDWKTCATPQGETHWSSSMHYAIVD